MISLLNKTNTTQFYNYKNFYDSCKQTQQIIYYLNTIIPLLWVIIGTITNILSLVVFSRRSMRRYSTFIYLAIMSFSDLIVIWSSSFRDYLAYKYNIYINGDIACKIHVFSFFVFTQFSSWLLVGANLDRLVFVISVNNYSKTWCTRRTAAKFATILLFILVLINLHFIIFIESKSKFSTFITSSNLTTTDNIIVNSFTKIVTVHPYVYPQCTLKNFSKYILFYSNIYTWIDSSLYCLLPFILMAICNTTLIKRVFTTKRNLYSKPYTSKNKRPKKTNSVFNLFRANTNSDNTTVAEKNSIRKISTHKTDQEYQQVSEQQLQQSNRGTLRSNSIRNTNHDAIERMRNMAITIIGVTILFIVFTVPINIYIPITLAISASNNTASTGHSSNQSQYNSTNVNNTEECQDLLFSILNNMVNANHSINFFLYYITNSKFNKEFKSLLMIFSNMRGFRARERLFSTANSTITNNVNTNNNNAYSNLLKSNSVRNKSIIKTNSYKLLNGNKNNNKNYLNTNCHTTMISLSSNNANNSSLIAKSSVFKASPVHQNKSDDNDMINKTDN